MPNKKYSDFIEISPTFESVVDIDADTRNKNLWREYIVGEDMEKMMEVLCQSLNKEEPDSRRSFWIEGTYTGVPTPSQGAQGVGHLLRNRKFRAAHGHRCNIAFVEANHNLVVLIQVEGSVVCDRGKIPFRHIGIEPVDFIFICRHLFFHLLFDIVADSG